MVQNVSVLQQLHRPLRYTSLCCCANLAKPRWRVQLVGGLLNVEEGPLKTCLSVNARRTPTAIVRTNLRRAPEIH